MPSHPRTHLVVALDGPASSGKSSVGMRAAARLGYRFFDTGILYRAVAWLAVREGARLDDATVLARVSRTLSVKSAGPAGEVRIEVSGREINRDVREAALDREASTVARVPEVRDALIGVQRAAAVEGEIIVAGRDIGTVVLPDADLKVYLDASVEERARRRCVERGVAPGGPEGDAILADLARRDAVDSSRATAPLRVPPDAIVIITDRLTLAGAVNELVAAVRSVEAATSGWPTIRAETGETPATLG
jgi:CMP/dCMP kinase